MLDWYREEDTGDLKISDLNDLVESMTRLNVLDMENGKINQNVVMYEKINQNVVTDEKINQDVVTDEKSGKN